MAQEGKKGMSIWGKLGLGCGGAIVLFILIAVVAGSGSSNKNTSSSIPVQSNTSSTGSTKQTETKKSFTKDEVITLKDHELYITGVQEDFDTGNPYLKPEQDSNMFVVVGVKIKNTGTKDLLFNPYGFKLEDGAGVQRDTTYLTGLENRLESATLSPGAEATGNIGFEAKKDSSRLILHYSGNIFSGGEVTIKLK